MRVKITFTFTGEGKVFNPYVTVPDLLLSRILVVTIPGISMKRNRDPTCPNNGYVVFLINTVSEESVYLNNNNHYHK